MIPGTAVGVLVGDLAYTWLAFRLARHTGRPDVTAMPLGLDTPGTFGMALFVLGPAFREAQAGGLTTEAAAHFAWHVGICTVAAGGLFKLVCSLAASRVRKLFPRAALLGSLTAVALVLISFLPLLEILHDPVVGLIALTIILTTLVARVPLPLGVPGALGALVAGSLVYYLLSVSSLFGTAAHEAAQAGMQTAWFHTEWLSAWRGQWFSAAGASLKYLPVVIPFTLAAVVGGIDCTESAAAAGDDYPTGRVIAIDGLATLVAALCGGVIQTTPYIGHPAYKSMGGRAAYTLATALLVGSAGVIGYFSSIYNMVPLAAVYPILIFVGLEITAQSFAATPERHYPAVALACVPAMAYLILIFVDSLCGETGASADKLSVGLAERIATLRLLGNGFIITSLLWGATLAALIDRRLRVAAAFLASAATASLLGIIHSPHQGAPIGFAWNLPAAPAFGPSSYALAGAYGSAAAMLVLWSFWDRRRAGSEQAPAVH
jgi:adenine/guanine/hypoxanthine permease